MWCYLDTHNPIHAKYILQYSTTVRYVVGFFTPDGKFVWHNGFENYMEAERLVNYLNGGNGSQFP